MQSNGKVIITDEHIDFGSQDHVAEFPFVGEKEKQVPSALIDLLECECGQVPTMFKPTLGKHMLGTNQQDNPGRFFSMLQCSCGITFDGVDFDENCEKLKAKWNHRIIKIRAL